MSGASAAKTLLQIQVNALKSQGKTLTKDKEDALLKEITDRYNDQLSPYYAASRLWVDSIITPHETRQMISIGIEAANHRKVEKFSVGVIQT